MCLISLFERVVVIEWLYYYGPVICVTAGVIVRTGIGNKSTPDNQSHYRNQWRCGLMLFKQLEMFQITFFYFSIS